MSTYKNWLIAVRPRTLVASVIPVFIGVILVMSDSHQINLLLASSCMLCCLFIQIGTNLFNDAIDFKNGADTSERLGPQRVTQSGLIEARYVMIGAIIAYLFAVLFSIPLIIQGGWIILLIGILSLYSGYAYTGEPFSLAYKGLGDLFVIVFFGVVAVMGVYYVQTLTFSLMSFIAGLQIGALSTVMIAINNLRDIEQDRKANKMTLAVRFGQKFVRYEILSLIVAAYGLSLYWLNQNKSWAFVLPLLTFPLAAKLIHNIFATSPGRIYNDYLSKSAQFLVLFSTATGIGLLI